MSPSIEAMIEHWNRTGKCLRHIAIDSPPLFCEQCGKPWAQVVDGRKGRRLRRGAELGRLGGVVQ